MAGGPLLPFSAYVGGAGSNLYSMYYSGAGGNAAPVQEGFGVPASLGADSTLQLIFGLPESLPSGTAKLRVSARAAATSGAAKLTVSDGVCDLASGAADPSATTLTGETQTTLTWGAGETDKVKRATVTLTPTLLANGWLVVAVKFQTSGWTLAAASCWLFELVWE